MAGAIEYPLVLMAEPAAIEAALAATPLKRPLLYAATKANLDAMAALAKKLGAPLAVKAAALDELGELTAKLDGLGVKDLVLDPGSRTLKETHQNLVYIRRAALKKKLRPFGYPIITFPAEETTDDMMETVHAAIYTIKYGGIIVLRDLSPEKAYALYVLRLNIYTDPQRPMQVEQGFYPINGADENSPVLITTNFSLTYFIVSSEVEGSKVPTWLGIVDTDGLSTLTAWAAGKFVPDRIAAFVNKSRPGRQGQAPHGRHPGLRRAAQRRAGRGAARLEGRRRAARGLRAAGVPEELQGRLSDEGGTVKIAVTGKGGVGKTTVAAGLARLFAREGSAVITIDADPDANLAAALGIDPEAAARIVPIAKMKRPDRRAHRAPSRERSAGSSSSTRGSTTCPTSSASRSTASSTWCSAPSRRAARAASARSRRCSRR